MVTTAVSAPLLSLEHGTDTDRQTDRRMDRSTVGTVADAGNCCTYNLLSANSPGDMGILLNFLYLVSYFLHVGYFEG